MNTLKPKGTWIQACEHAAKYANKKGRDIRDAARFLYRAGWILRPIGILTTLDMFCANRCVLYIEAGNTFKPTVICENNICWVQPWGEWARELETRCRKSLIASQPDSEKNRLTGELKGRFTWGLKGRFYDPDTILLCHSCHYCQRTQTKCNEFQSN